MRFGNFLQVRSVNYDTLEAIFAGKTTAQKGLTDSVAAGNKLLRKFEKANK
jgi:sn-glycerol 3-phosphate transport system substrate-binding protein